jgi:hypothetical protein
MFHSLETLDLIDQRFITNTLNLVNVLLEEKHSLKKKVVERYVNLLKESKSIIEEGEIKQLQMQTHGFSGHKQVLSYIDECIRKLYAKTESGLYQNITFRNKNLRGAKVEELYFKVYDLLKDSMEELEPFQGKVDGKEILNYIEEYFEYVPLYQKDESHSFEDKVIKAFQERNIPLIRKKINISEAEETNNTVIVLEGPVHDLISPLILVDHNIVEEHLYSTLSSLHTQYTTLSFISPQETILYGKTKRLVFEWIHDSFESIDSMQGTTFQFITLKVLKNKKKKKIWEIIQF